jgi:hypothetical protein
LSFLTTIRSPFIAQDGAEPVHRLSGDVGCDVSVDVAGDGARGMAEDLGDHLERDAASEQNAGGGVPERVQAGFGQTGTYGGDLQRTEGVARIAGFADLGGDTKTVSCQAVPALERSSACFPSIRDSVSADAEGSLVQVYLGPLEAQRPATAQPGQDQEGEQRSLPGLTRRAEQVGELCGCQVCGLLVRTHGASRWIGSQP